MFQNIFSSLIQDGSTTNKQFLYAQASYTCLDSKFRTAQIKISCS